MDVPMHPEIERVVVAAVERGEYPSVAAMVEEALFLLVERDWARSQAELLERAPSVFDSTPPTPADEERL